MLKNGYRADPNGASESPARDRCGHGRLRWDRRNTTSRQRGSSLSTCAPRRCPDGDGAERRRTTSRHHSEGTPMWARREGRIIAGVCRWNRQIVAK